MNNKNSVIASTPEQLRVLADSADESLSYIGDGDWYPQDTMLQQTASALRAAADQLEAAAELTADVGWQRDYWAERIAAVERVADTAQDDEDGNGWVPIDPLLDALYPEKRAAL